MDEIHLIIMPEQKDFERYRFYQCVPSTQGYRCIQQLIPNDIILYNSKLVVIDKWVPRILDGVVIKYKLIPYITVK